jgi:3-amino-4-hydroxybenzoic acid synthase
MEQLDVKELHNELEFAAGIFPANQGTLENNALVGALAGGGETRWWFDGRGATDATLWTSVEASNCTHVVLTPSQLRSCPTGKRRVIWIESIDELSGLPVETMVLAASEEIRRAAAAFGHCAGLMVIVSDLKAEFPTCVGICERGDPFVVIDIEHATYIPYELLIAKAGQTGTQILRSVPIKGLTSVVGDVDQSLNAMATMEQGVGVFFRTDDLNAVAALSANVASRKSHHVNLVAVEVVEVQHTGLGHRVCVDTTSFMTAEEGMIVGSTGWGGIFVCSETHYLPHMNLREFRVNAGAVHSYVWGADGRALYLSEMGAGTEIICVNRDGSARAVTVGRAKIERRPMLNVRCRVALTDVPIEVRELVLKEQKLVRSVTPGDEEIAGVREGYLEINAFLQNDWHVRVMGADGAVRHCTLLRPGDRLLAHVDAPGRHTGIRVAEHIIER